MTIVDAVVIGRNEGARLLACLKSLDGQVRRIVYVDSGSSDGSVVAAAASGAEVVELELGLPFTAARARNAGLAQLAADPPDFVQLVDGDCSLAPDWVASAVAFLTTHSDVAVVCGRRRERFPDASVYNRLADAEWDTPIGSAKACGGDALMRFAPLWDAGGYREDLIAGEEPELCLRLRRAGWGIWRIEAEMTLHDAAMMRFSQWWRRTRRAGYAFAEGAALHGQKPERHWVVETRRALLWGVVLPGVALAGGVFVHPLFLAMLVLWPLQAFRLGLRWGGTRPAWERAAFNVLGKVPEGVGVLQYASDRVRGKRGGLIEYK